MRCIALAAACLLLVANTKQARAADAAGPDLSSPEKAFESLRLALATGDRGNEFRCYTPRTQHQLLGMHIGIAVAVSRENMQEGPLRELSTEATGLLKRHGIDSNKFPQEVKPQQALPPALEPAAGQEAIPAKKEEAEEDKYIRCAEREATEPDVLFAKLWAWKLRYGAAQAAVAKPDDFLGKDFWELDAKGDRFEQEEAKKLRLESVKIDGDLATVQLHGATPDSSALQFQRIDGRWLLDRYRQ